jgi:hypothetical protein
VKRKRFTSVVALLFLLGPTGLAHAPLRPARLDLGLMVRPDIRLTRPLGREPTDQELALLSSLKGRSQQQVLRLLGHPACCFHLFAKDDTEEKAVREGREVWEYSWGGVAFVHFRRGVAEGTSYHGPNTIAQIPCD